MTVDEAFNANPIKTNKIATIEDINESIVKAFQNWNDNSKDEPRYTLKELLAQTDYEAVREATENETNVWLSAPAIGRALL